MTDVHLSEFMELDSYWENAVKDAAQNAVHSQRRLELALQNRKRINKILENSGYRPVLVEMTRNSKEEESVDKDGDDDDDEEVLTVSSCNDNPHTESFMESMNEVDHEENTKSGPSTKRKAMLTLAQRNYLKEKNRSCIRDKGGSKIKKRNVEFSHEPLEDGPEDGKNTYSSGHYSKMSPYVLRKKRLAVLTAQIKRKKRNTNMKKHEKRTKNIRMKSKSYRTKRSRKKMEQGSNKDNNRDEKQDLKSENQGTKVDNSNGNEANGNSNNEDIKKSSVAGKEAPALKVGQNGGKNASNVTGPSKTEKDHSKGDCNQDSNPKGNDISKYGDVCKEMAMDCGIRGLPQLCTIKGTKRNCGGSRKMKYKQRRRRKKRIGPFIKFYMTVYKELRGTCSIKSIAKEAGKRWRCMSRKEKLKFYPRKYR